MELTFFGVRGSTPCDGPEFARFGGNTSCVVVEAAGHPPVILDLGTGLRSYGSAVEAAREDPAAVEPYRASVLLTHLHWDHVQGLPFFAPLFRADATVEVFGPHHDDGPLAELFAGLMCPPYFPIRPDDLAADLRFTDVGDDTFDAGDAKVTSRRVPHTGPTLGFRVELAGRRIAYLPDHGPDCHAGAASAIAPAVLELCDGVDLLIHDAQYTPEEYEERPTWGHSTIDYALHVAQESGARSLALFHHDPAHSDDALDALVDQAVDRARRLDIPSVFAAHDSQRVTFEPVHAASGSPIRGLP
ncbi:MAG: metal-dependent hydrolase, beta-lactamase superfamily [Actinomycetia bacterium]|nr:metal-dependent hydrolase, beta-lactamase superfamily [Actinomycetes bacterium]